MNVNDFSLPPGYLIEVNVRLIKKLRHEGEPVFRTVGRSVCFIEAEASPTPYRKVANALQSAVCRAFEAIVTAPPAEKKPGPGT